MTALAVILGSTRASAQEPPPSSGQILVVTEPAGARVFVDGAEVGTAPVSVPSLVPGAHLVVAIDGGGARVERIVEVEAGHSALVQLALPAPSTSPTTTTTTPTATTSEASTTPSAPPAPATPVAQPATPPTEASAPAAHELAASDLSSPVVTSAATEHEEDEPIAATGFPGLLGLTLGVRIDVPIYVVNPVPTALVDPMCGLRCGTSTSTIVAGRLSIELGLDPAFDIVTAIDLGSGAFAVGAAANLPGYLPLTREVAIALQPHLQGLVYYHPAGAVLLSAEASLRIGIAPIPHLVIGAEVGVIVLGALPFRGAHVVEGAYVGPIVGGGVEWAFY